MAATFSVVCNTLNRADALRNLLVALRHQTHPIFEVVVVAGPCTDHTADVMADFADVIKARWCPEPNLSMSRNIGIAASSGDLIAFIDDDAVPEHTWLDQLAALYSSDEVGGAGGAVHDHTGYGFQTRFILCDRTGRAEYSDETPFDDFCFPGTTKYPSVLGCNSSFRRSALLEIGGFDEEFEYYLDETDVCVRLVDAGYVIRQSPNAEVHHKFLPSDVRDHHKVVLNNYPIVKNAIYFSFVNGRDHLSLREIYGAAADFSAARIAELEYHRHHHRITESQLDEALSVIDEAWAPGIAVGERGRARMYDPALEDEHGGPFQPYPTIMRDGRRLRLCIVTQTLPPEVPGGIGRYCLDLARELGARGHDIRVITRGDDHDRVDFEDGVWVHRILDRPDVENHTGLVVPAGVWARTAAVAAEVVRMQTEGAVDAVYAPIWDSEAVAVAAASSALSITGLMTTMGISLLTRPSWSEDPEFMEALGDPLHQLERHLLASSHGLHAISNAIVGEIETASSVSIGRSGLLTSYLGVVDDPLDDLAATASPAGGPVTVVYVGRFERRKGIDLLLGALPALLTADPTVRVEMFGRDDLPGDDGRTPRAAFEALHCDADWLDRVTFHGEASDEDVADSYRRADVFVAPSRFESFGLIFVEAMRAGTPVVALARGAAPEVIGDAGVLVEPDSDDLATALIDLVGDPARRAELGKRARRRFERLFTVPAMTDRFEAHLRGCTTIRVGDERIGGVAGAVELSDDTHGALVTTSTTIGPLPTGRTTVVVTAAPDEGVPPAATVEVNAGAWSRIVELRSAFTHVTVPDGTPLIELRALTGHPVLAAVHVVPDADDSHPAP